MSKSIYVDFKAVKAALTMERVLEHYGLLPRFKRSGDSLSGPCPIHKGSNPTQFRVSISKNVWNCFSECKHGGNVLDFICKMEAVDIHQAALKAIQWFGLEAESLRSNSGRAASDVPTDAGRNGSSVASGAVRPEPAVEQGPPNKPLKFRLDKLEREHPYLTERGLSAETIAEFDIGFCGKGTMEGRIAIPIANLEGQTVAYAGRIPSEPTEGVPKYKLPQGFRRALELFNLHRAVKEPADRPLIIVEGFFDCMKLHEHGCRKVVALMGSTLSGAQEELIRKNSSSRSHIIVALDENEAGRAGREDIACRLSKVCFVRIQTFKPDIEPEHLSKAEVEQMLGGAL